MRTECLQEVSSARPAITATGVNKLATVHSFLLNIPKIAFPKFTSWDVIMSSRRAGQTDWLPPTVDSQAAVVKGLAEGGSADTSQTCQLAMLLQIDDFTNISPKFDTVK